MLSVTGDAQGPTKYLAATLKDAGLPWVFLALCGHHRYPGISPVASDSSAQVPWSSPCSSSWGTETGEPSKGEQIKGPGMMDKHSNKFRLREVEGDTEQSDLPLPEASSHCSPGLSLRVQKATGEP